MYTYYDRQQELRENPISYFALLWALLDIMFWSD